MTFFDTLTKRQQEYRDLREQQYQQALDCIKAASEGGGIHKKGVHRKTGVREHILNRMVDDMHQRKLIHVIGWQFERSALVALYVIGEGEDAPRAAPVITPKAVQQKERRQGSVSMSAEQQLRAAVERKHHDWEAKWKPHRDPAAAWL